jgi:glucose-1-phosphate cytidylyltransferase
MKVIILAGGQGTRLQEETIVKPKPMVEIGGYPILWHIMKTFACHGHTDFAVAMGYKAEVIRAYLLNFY